MSLKAVIFDFGGVLVRTHDQSLRASWERRLGLTPGGASAYVFEGEHGRAAQHGWITDADHWRWIGQQLAVDTLAQFRADFFRHDVLDLELIAYIDRLRAAGYHLGLLSNAGDNARHIFTEVYPVLSHFDSVTTSAEEGVMKPDPRIFRVALARAGVQPYEAVFVDDVAENIEGAREVGMLGVHFRASAAAISELAALTGVR